MLSLWRDLLDVRGLLDVNGELLVGSAHDDGVSLTVMKRDGVADLVCSVPRTAAAMFAIGGGQAPRRYYYIMGKDVCAGKLLGLWRCYSSPWKSRDNFPVKPTPRKLRRLGRE